MITPLGYNTERLYDDTIVPKLGPYFHLTSGMRIEPSFFIIGVQKGGTTSLCHYMMQHPRVLNPQDKDVYFFHNTLNYNKGMACIKPILPISYTRYIMN